MEYEIYKNRSLYNFDDDQTVEFQVLRMIQVFIGLVGNTMVIIAVVRNNKLHLPGNVILVSLALYSN